MWKIYTQYSCQATWNWFTETENSNYLCNESFLKKLLGTQLSFKAIWNWFTDPSNYEDSMYLLWKNFLIYKVVAKPHETDLETLQTIKS